MLELVFDGLRPGLLLTLSRKTGRKWKRILTYRRLLSAMAQSALKNNLLFAATRPVPENFLPQFRCAQVFLEGDRRRKDRNNPHLPGLALQRDARQQTGDEQTGCGKTCTHRAKNIGEVGEKAPAMALDASQIRTRSKNHSENNCLLYHSTVVKCEPFERSTRRNRKTSKRCK